MFLEIKENIRITDELDAKIEEVLKKYRGKYENKSHFIRCAIMRAVNEDLAKSLAGIHKKKKIEAEILKRPRR